MAKNKAKLVPNLILHIEDDYDWVKTVYGTINESKQCMAEFGGKFSRVDSQIDYELPQSELTREISRLEAEIKKSGSDPLYISIVSGQVARTLLQDYLPSVMISDTGFPMNGKKTVDWLLDHNLGNYPLIGLSATPLANLDEHIKDFFVTRNARYFQKQTYSSEDLVFQVIYNHGFTIINQRKLFS